MLRSLFSGVAGLRNHQVRMDTLSNNIANVNTTGFKASTTNFQDALNQTLQSGGNGRDPMQVGTGISTASIGTDVTQGALENTGRTLDLAIQGTGFFQVSDGTNTYFTRNGTFFVDDLGDVVNSNGLKLQSNGGGDINLGTNPISTLAIDTAGNITGTDVTGTAITGAQIGISTFTNPQGLTKSGDSLYTADPAITGTETDGAPGSGGAGTIQSGYLEMSNTDLSNEFTNMITTQRGYQACARVITVSDTLLQELIDLKRQ